MLLSSLLDLNQILDEVDSIFLLQSSILLTLLQVQRLMNSSECISVIMSQKYWVEQFDDMHSGALMLFYLSL